MIESRDHYTTIGNRFTRRSQQLLSTDRMKHWQLNGPGGEENLKRLKLSPRPPRTT
jgi:hypothetical protein